MCKCSEFFWLQGVMGRITFLPSKLQSFLYFSLKKWWKDGLWLLRSASSTAPPTFFRAFFLLPLLSLPSSIWILPPSVSPQFGLCSGKKFWFVSIKILQGLSPPQHLQKSLQILGICLQIESAWLPPSFGAILRLYLIIYFLSVTCGFSYSQEYYTPHCLPFVFSCTDAEFMLVV